MKSTLQGFFIFAFFAASPAWAHSICQYQDSETRCHEYLECTWIPGANDSGQCVYEKTDTFFERAQPRPSLGETLRNPDGSFRHVNQYDADTYCKSQGTRLPTLRELAVYAQSLGAQGISETEKDGYWLVKGSDSAGNPDNFYFNANGYRRPTGELGSFWIWSSSVSPYQYPDNAYGLNGNNGAIYIHTRTAPSDGYGDYGVVRCAL